MGDTLPIETFGNMSMYFTKELHIDRRLNAAFDLPFTSFIS